STPPADDNEDGGNGGGTGGGDKPPRAAITTVAACDARGVCRARTGVPVAFEDTSTGTVRSRRWDFGEGSGSRRSGAVEHAWSEPGFYEVTLWTSNGTDESTASLTFLVEASDPAGTCVADAETLCLLDSRYAVGVEWWTAGGESAEASVVHAGTNDSGLFWFLGPDNWEVLVKVLDACELNGNVWVFAASTTDLGYSIRVTDTVSGIVKDYRNEPGMPAPATTDGEAFPGSCQP
ncbi:MAG: PKD domain-containing protein, partial [Holophagales bacterium]|nr:PKD domain-containing protein [Holophagales bacterium]